MSEALSEESLRLDKWLFHARFFKSRTLAGKFLEEGRLRLDGSKITKSHIKVRSGMVLTFPHGGFVRVIKILALGQRRGPASEARTLYEDLSPPAEQPRLPRKKEKPTFARDPGSGRPTKRDRRQMDRLREEP